MKQYLQESDRGILLADATGTILFCNPRLLELLGLREAQLVGGNLEPFLTLLNDSTRVNDACRNALVTGLRQAIANRTTYKPADFCLAGGWLAVHGRAMREGGFALSVSDVTEQYNTLTSLHRSNRATVLALAELAESRDQTTGDHVLRVARMTHAIAHVMARQGHFPETLTRHFLDNIALASVLHDIGKVAVPDRILLKPGMLEPEERLIIQKHAEQGRDLLRHLNTFLNDAGHLAMAERIAGTHHEKFVGGGYPTGIAGEEIPLEGRIAALADVFDALMSERPYKQAWSEEKTVAWIQQEAGRMFDPLVVAAFLEVLRERDASVHIVWTPDMSVGERLLDFDHLNLIMILNQVHQSIQQQDMILFELISQELFNYTVGHFSREEGYMRDLGYPHLERHVAIHRSMTRKVHEIRDHFLNTPYSATRQESGRELLEFLSGWLKEHILREDMQYRRFALRSRTD
ncbi:MAG: bacteriohemerythrin [Magnetococcales bacterium]|nr:bacteriohemerythrin [Magnetococcales bacterium]